MFARSRARARALVHERTSDVDSGRVMDAFRKKEEATSNGIGYVACIRLGLYVRHCDEEVKRVCMGLSYDRVCSGETSPSRNWAALSVAFSQ